MIDGLRMPSDEELARSELERIFNSLLEAEWKWEQLKAEKKFIREKLEELKRHPGASSIHPKAWVSAEMRLGAI